MRWPIIIGVTLLGLPALGDQPGVAVWRMTPANATIYPAVNAPGAFHAVNGAGSISATSDGSSYVVTDNLDARACALAGVMMPDGTLVGNGGVARVKMTTNGGKPANGATVWIATPQEDIGGPA